MKKIKQINDVFFTISDIKESTEKVSLVDINKRLENINTKIVKFETQLVILKEHKKILKDLSSELRGIIKKNGKTKTT